MNRLNEFYTALDRSYAQGGSAAAEAFLLSALNSCCSDVPLLIAANNELGSLCRGAGQYDRSAALFCRAAELTAGLVGETSTQYATVLNNLAGTYRMAGDQEKAIETFHRCMQTYRAAGENDPYLHASVWNNLSLAHLERGEYPRAAECLERALELIRQAPGREKELAVTLENLAHVRRAMEREGQA